MTYDPHFVMETLPALPSEMSPGAAALWAANVLMISGVERGWPMDEVADLLFTLAAFSAVNRNTDDELHASLQAKLDTIRSAQAAKN
ncbi:hypothetical protein [Pseudoxanthomonas koreensis]|uniref:hypothetical protein n=1 Tax=Pseudoxanthomonas koreensis TaxID=266061 RepID=UPI0013910659|nr:hypothetical protein [Pseudoxanthomonas koreensis]KAF1691855.1 hypothetical protein CSC64_08040 [Pseudoxanthomonas koreensis]